MKMKNLNKKYFRNKHYCKKTLIQTQIYNFINQDLLKINNNIIAINNIGLIYNNKFKI